MVKRPFRWSTTDRETLRRSGTGRDTFPEGRNWSRDPPGGTEVVGRPSQRSRSGRETLPKFRKWSDDPPRCPEVVGRLSRRTETGRETLPEVR